MLLTLALTVFLGPEIVSDRFTTPGNPPGCSAAAVAHHGHQTFLAWSTADQGFAITTTLLNVDFGEIRGARKMLPRALAPTCLEAAKSDSDVLLVWTEARPVGLRLQDLWVARFSASGSLLDAPRMIAATVKDPARADIAWSSWNGGTYLIVAGTQWFELGSGSPLDQMRAHELAAWPNYGRTGYFDSVAPTARAFGLTAKFFDPAGQRCNVARPGCSRFPGETVLGAAAPHWIWPADVTTVIGEDHTTSTIGCIGDDCLVVWLASHVHGRWLSSGGAFELASNGAASGTIASASDGRRILVVWETSDRRIRGVAISPDGVGEPFVVVDGAEWRRQPAVIALADGRFLVAYEITPNQPAKVQLGGRVVSIYGDAPPRRRAVR